MKTKQSGVSAELMVNSINNSVAKTPLGGVSAELMVNSINNSVAKTLKIAFSILLLSWVFVLNSCGGGSGGGTSIAPSPTPTTAVPVITAFSINGSAGVIPGNKIAITVPFGTKITALTATFTAPGSVVTVGGVPQVSGVTTNDFTQPVTYTVTRVSASTTSSVKASASNTTTYTVTVTVASISAKAITAFSLGTSPSASVTPGIISILNVAVTVPFGTNVKSLIATFTTSGQSVTVNGVKQVSGTTPNDFTNPVTYTVTAADGTTQNYTVTVTVASASANDIISFSLNGTPGVISSGGLSQTIVVKVPNGTNVTGLVASFITTGSSVAVNGTAQVSGRTQNDFTNPVTYIVTSANGIVQTYTVTVIVSSTSSSFINAYSFGNVTGVISGQNITATVPNGTDVTALIATFTTTGINVTVSGATQTSTATPNNFTNPVVYTVIAADGSTSTYTVTIAVASTSSKAITAFAFGTTAGVIMGQTIAVTMPFGTDVTDLVATFTTTGVKVSVNGVTQTSGSTLNNFTKPVSYVVTAADGSTATYVVTVTVASSSAKAITAFSLLGVTGSISGLNITVAVPNGRNVTALVATFTTTGSSVTVNGVTQFSGTTTNNFTNPVSYLVTAADGSTNTYTVTVTFSANVWTWFSGSNLVSQTGVYGTQGVASASNVPGARGSSVTWTDSAGNLWLFGGSLGGTTRFNDLWKYNPNTGQWTWVGGSNLTNQSGVYGTQGTPSASNIPGARQLSSSWLDSSGNLWLFGGNGYDSAGSFGQLNDLWKYNPTTNQWTWVGILGSNIAGQSGVYGTQGMASASNTPGGRRGGVSWIDSSGNMWLFGGQGFDSTGFSGFLNDLWKYNPTTNQWTWVGILGSNNASQNGVYGTQGMASASNTPGGRWQAVSWIDSSGNFWLFGGFGLDSGGSGSSLNDLWKYNPTTNQWTWVGGSNIVNQLGVYGTQGVASA